jgi:hypothetical protein
MAVCSSTPYISRVLAVLRKHSSASLCFSPLKQPMSRIGWYQHYANSSTMSSSRLGGGAVHMPGVGVYLCPGYRASTLDRKSSSCSGRKWLLDR